MEDNGKNPWHISKWSYNAMTIFDFWYGSSYFIGFVALISSANSLFGCAYILQAQLTVMILNK